MIDVRFFRARNEIPLWRKTGYTLRAVERKVESSWVSKKTAIQLAQPALGYEVRVSPILRPHTSLEGRQSVLICGAGVVKWREESIQ